MPTPVFDGPEFLITSTTTAYRTTIRTITALSDGSFLTTWEVDDLRGGDTSKNGVWGQIFGANGDPSGSEFVITLDYQESPLSPQVAALPDGRFVAVWRDAAVSSATNVIRAQIFETNGSRFGQEIVVSSDMPGRNWNPSIATLSDG